MARTHIPTREATKLPTHRPSVIVKAGREELKWFPAPYFVVRPEILGQGERASPKSHWRKAERARRESR